MLGLVAAAVMASWCDGECVVRAHPLFHRWGLGAPELQYTFTLTPRGVPRVHRFQLGWALPIAETLEVFTGAALATDGRLELVPGARFSPLQAGAAVVPALAVSAPMAWNDGVLELRVRPALELHLGFVAMVVAVDVDVAERPTPRFWLGSLLSL